MSNTIKNYQHGKEIYIFHFDYINGLAIIYAINNI